MSGEAHSEARLIVAIDGPGGVGKSTVARAIARRLGVPYLETGAMYRALGLKALEAGVALDDEAAVERLAIELDLEMEVLPDGRTVIRLDGEPLGDRIRDEAVAQAASRVATLPAVRRRMVEMQRRFGLRGGGVLEGRDIGTKVFPDTPYKFFLDADPEIRLARRLGEHRARGVEGADLEELRRELAERDRRDSERADSPLTKDASYVVVDTSELRVEQVVDRLESEIARRAGGVNRRADACRSSDPSGANRDA